MFILLAGVPCLALAMNNEQKTKSIINDLFINPFSTNVPLLCPLKTSENLSFSDVFKEYRCGALVEN